jgi:hypothetical protein
MSLRPWEPDRPLTVEDARSIIRGSFPRIDAHTVDHLEPPLRPAVALPTPDIPGTLVRGKTRPPLARSERGPGASPAPTPAPGDLDE